jgi:TM2 domain-containing membrane protein YozV
LSERVLTAILAILLGSFGVHKFYLGDTGLGILYLCFSWTGIPAIVGIIEGVIYLSKSDEEFEKEYVHR